MSDPEIDVTDVESEPLQVHIKCKCVSVLCKVGVELVRESFRKVRFAKPPCAARFQTTPSFARTLVCVCALELLTYKLVACMRAVMQDSDEDDGASLATTVKLGDHLVSENEVVESPCDFCEIMPENEGCCVGCGCALVPRDKAMEEQHNKKNKKKDGKKDKKIPSPAMRSLKKTGSDSDDELPAFVVEAAKTMEDSQEAWVAIFVVCCLQL